MSGTLNPILKVGAMVYRHFTLQSVGENGFRGHSKWSENGMVTDWTGTKTSAVGMQRVEATRATLPIADAWDSCDFTWTLPPATPPALPWSLSSTAGFNLDKVETTVGMQQHIQWISQPQEAGVIASLEKAEKLVDFAFSNHNNQYYSDAVDSFWGKAKAPNYFNGKSNYPREASRAEREQSLANRVINKLKFWV